MTELLTPLLNVGAVGVVLAWFMMRLEGKVAHLEQAADRNTRAMMLLLIGINGLSPQEKRQAKDLLREAGHIEGP